MPNLSERSALARSRAEEEFLATQKKNEQEIEEKEKQRGIKAHHVANLKAQRLAKEAADREASAPSAPRKSATKKKSAELPKFHRF